jgi:VIT1/CCC1 family predicted Fe2+/Mn2+ transporter
MNETDNWRSEKQSAWLYRIIAARESAAGVRRMFERLAEAAETQAREWEQIGARLQRPVPQDFTPDLRAHIVGWLVRWLGPRRLMSVLAAMKIRGLSAYTHSPVQAHAGAKANGLESRHMGITGGGNFRAAIFGVNDGLVSNASLIMGVAGASQPAHIILLTGLAGLLAGAASMAAGEYVSMRSQREMFEHQIGLERDELATYPEEEAAELALIYEGRGLELHDARYIADVMVKEPDRALDTLAREELGLNPQELGSPWGAALSSLLSFAVGAVIPLVPLFWGDLAISLWVTIGLTLLALFMVGTVTSLFTGRAWLWSGLRMMIVGILAGGVTYGLGHLFGIAVG